ncbi:MAG: T9SS type A sorting domain-containing protein, partial [Ferruginibacter sp.]
TGSNNTPYPNPGNVSSISGLNYGYYNVTITDAAGCGTVTYSNIHVEFAYYVYVTNIGSLSSSCGNTGSITLYGNAGITPYTYSLNGTSYQSGNSFTNLAAGSYTAYVKDAAGCISTKSIAIGSAAPIIVSPLVRAATSCNNDGSIEIYRSGGIPGYTYSLDNVTYQPGNVFLNLAAGSYTAWVKDSKGCTGSQAITVGQGSGLTLSANKTNTSTCVNDGTIQVNASGGVSPYTYSIDGGITYQSGNFFSGLTNTTYVISVKDFKGCLGSINVTISLNPIVVTYSATASGSCAVSSGKVQLFRTGGVGPYTYSLDGNTYQPGNTFLNLSPGTYQGFVKDSKTCIGAVNGIVVGPSGCLPPPFTKNSKAATPVLPNTPLTIQLYPNPSENEFTLILYGYNKVENVSIKVVDLLGRQVYQLESNAKGKFKFGKDFLAGLYNVEVVQGMQKRSIKIVKK